MPDRAPRIVVRSDGSPSIGLGHVMRSLTIARALSDMGCSVRVAGAGVLKVGHAAVSAKLQIADRSDVRGDASDAASLADGKPDLVIVDGYHFGSEFFRTLEDSDIDYMVIDDNGTTSAQSPALVLNQNPHAAVGLYRHMRKRPVLLLGLGYALVRPEIATLANERFQRVRGSVFVAMGGSDPLELTGSIVEAVAANGSNVLVALGPAHPSRVAVAQRLAGPPNVSIIEPGAYGLALATSEVAVLAAGTSLWEAACLGTPTIGVVVAENQLEAVGRSVGTAFIVNALLNDKPAAAVSDYAARLSADQKLRSRTAAAGRRQINVAGAARVARVVWDYLSDVGDRSINA